MQMPMVNTTRYPAELRACGAEKATAICCSFLIRYINKHALTLICRWGGRLGERGVKKKGGGWRGETGNEGKWEGVVGKKTGHENKCERQLKLI